MTPEQIKEMATAIAKAIVEEQEAAKPENRLKRAVDAGIEQFKGDYVDVDGRTELIHRIAEFYPFHERAYKSIELYQAIYTMPKNAAVNYLHDKLAEHQEERAKELVREFELKQKEAELEAERKELERLKNKQVKR